ncbi:acyl carrier protein [Saccharopolyspora erythraea]|uniref:acyl carrier protein n=1 Tax=Saccharopolyspora erythraea TaxID=1836 RepID=UPI001BAD2D93|nr:acyl carrier protein [Saccharopolyspora erythraea]QUH03651.1 acyl carrier protein [Saccharopolyspora erythraea]
MSSGTQAEGSGRTAEGAALDLLGEVLYVEAGKIDLDAGFTELGLDSILAVEYVSMLKSELGVEQTVAALYELGTPRALFAGIAAQA